MSGMKARYESVAELNARGSLFRHPHRSASGNTGPFLWVQDDFYPDPEAIRRLALAQPFFQYSPPLAEQVGVKRAQRSRGSPPWLATALLRYWGRPVAQPHPGFRYAPESVRSALEAAIGERIDAASWDSMGDGWNGAFHLQYAPPPGTRSAVHHHYKPGDVEPRGWSGVVYLNPDAPASAGTTIWRDRQTGMCVAAKGVRFTRDPDRFELALRISNRFNRLVLFRENVLHRSEPGFGSSPEDGRLTQTFFFLAEG